MHWWICECGCIVEYYNPTWDQILVEQSWIGSDLGFMQIITEFFRFSMLSIITGGRKLFGQNLQSWNMYNRYERNPFYSDYIAFVMPSICHINLTPIDWTIVITMTDLCKRVFSMLGQKQKIDLVKNFAEMLFHKVRVYVSPVELKKFASQYKIQTT